MSILREMEWSGRYRDSTGSRMGFEDVDCSYYPACPKCGGIRPDRFPYYLDGYAQKGHKPGCGLKAELS